MVIDKLYGGIEAGGTKFVCAVADEQGTIQDSVRFPTTTPDETLAKASAFFREYVNRLVSLGIGSFGPISLDPNTTNFGAILQTPKEGWSNVGIYHYFNNQFSIPIAIDTDVNAAAYNEYHVGAAVGLDTFVYITIGTGIGGGGMVGGKLMHGALHPEMGHIVLPILPEMSNFHGICPFHEDCFEGLASGPAMRTRWGINPELLPADHPAWEVEARVIALALHNIIHTIAPQRIILGGGVMQSSHLLGMIHHQLQEQLGGYIPYLDTLAKIEAYITPPMGGSWTGVSGAIALGMHYRESL